MRIARKSNASRRRGGLGTALLATALLGLAPAVLAQPVEVEGTVQDVDGDPVVGARVVYRLVEDDRVFISPPTDDAGRYAVGIPSGELCRPVAVLVADGARVDLGEVAPARAAAGMSQQITIELPRRWNPSAVVQNFPGSDRLFHSFVEDTAIVERYRFEVRAQRQEGDTVDRGRMSLLGVAQFAAIPQVEFGAGLNLVGVNTTAGREGDGLGDTDLWAKYVLGATRDSRHELAFGVVATLPTGSDSDGTGYDSTRSKLFVAGRREISWGVLTGNLGLAVHGDGRFFGSVLPGETTFSVGAGVIVPWTFRLAFVGEAGFESERFRGFDHETFLLGGVNVLLKNGSLRGALGLGLSDGSPDVEVTLGYAFPF